MKRKTKLSIFDFSRWCWSLLDRKRTEFQLIFVEIFPRIIVRPGEVGFSVCQWRDFGQIEPDGEKNLEKKQPNHWPNIEQWLPQSTFWNKVWKNPKYKSASILEESPIISKSKNSRNNFLIGIAEKLQTRRRSNGATRKKGFHAVEIVALIKLGLDGLFSSWKFQFSSKLSAKFCAENSFGKSGRSSSFMKPRSRARSSKSSIQLNDGNKNISLIENRSFFYPWNNFDQIEAFSNGFIFFQLSNLTWKCWI